jgi:hypothetical protein
MTVRDVISPLAYSLFQWFGYGLFIAIWLFICFAAMRAALDARQLAQASRRPRQMPIPFPARSGRLILFPSPARRKATPYA